MWNSVQNLIILSLWNTPLHKTSFHLSFGFLWWESPYWNKTCNKKAHIRGFHFFVLTATKLVKFKPNILETTRKSVLLTRLKCSLINLAPNMLCYRKIKAPDDFSPCSESMQCHLLKETLNNYKPALRMKMGFYSLSPATHSFQKHFKMYFFTIITIISA